VVICSSDEEYTTLAGPLTEGIKKGNKDIQVIIAGYPKEIIESLKSAGVDDFIHIKCNVLETLKKFHKHFGI